jgi:hypothetical protein
MQEPKLKKRNCYERLTLNDYYHADRITNAVISAVTIKHIEYIMLSYIQQVQEPNLKNHNCRKEQKRCITSLLKLT